MREAPLIWDAPTSPRRVSIRRHVAIGRRLRSLAVGGPASLLIGGLVWPLFFSSSYFAGDWIAQVWFMWKQSLTIQAGHLPSLFLNYPHGVFYPQYAFYGGTLYALTGVLSLALGNAPIEAYALTYVLAFAAAYGGWYWIARLSGLGRWWGQVPGLVFITSSYYLTLVYGRGDWPEFVGVSMIPLMIAAGLSVLRSHRLHMWPALALTVSAVFFFGSHNLTLLWGSTTIFLVGLAIVICIPQARQQITRAGLVRLARIAVPALLISAWFLVPAVVYESNTYIANEFATWQEWLRSTMRLVSSAHLFTVSRATAGTPGSGFVLSLPILVMGWALVGLAIALRTGLRAVWTRIVLICAGVTVLWIVLMTHAGLILALPRLYATLQFSYRLESYVLLGLSGMVLALLVLAQQSGSPRLRAWRRWALPPILAVGIVGAIQQAAAYPVTADRESSFVGMYHAPSAPGETLLDYLDVRQPALTAPNGRPAEVNFDTTPAQGSRISKVVHLRPHELVFSNLLGPPPLIHVTGARIVGLNPSEGSDVLEIEPPPSSSSGQRAPFPAETISVSPATSLPVLLGRVLSLCAAIALISQFVLLALRRRGPARASDSP